MRERESFEWLEEDKREHPTEDYKGKKTASRCFESAFKHIEALNVGQVGYPDHQ